MGRIKYLIVVSWVIAIAFLAGLSALSGNVVRAGQRISKTSQLGPPPGSYTTDVDQDKFILPFTFYGMNLMVDARMNGADIKMLIDNGVMWDELLFYGSDLVDGLGMDYEGGVLVTGAGDDRDKGIESYTATGVSISFGPVTFHDQAAVITSKASGWADFFPGIAGQVCGALFKHFVVEFDFDEQNLILHRRETFQYQGKGSPVAMTRDENGAYAIPVKVKTRDKPAVDYSLFIDLGGINPMALVISEKYGIEKPGGDKVYLAHGASGEITGYRDVLESVTIGGYELNDVPVVLTEADDEGDHTNKTLGLPLLMHFNLVFDYFNETLYLEPNEHFAGSFETPTD
ncbi:MAG: hypothetical protein OQJ84_08820 [Xanthomonadales bacterium]|nr:hypothetical protein [Xanthomonadales bacterium]